MATYEPDLEPIKDVQLFHAGRYAGEYPARMQGYIPNKVALFRCCNDNKLYKSNYDADRSYSKASHGIAVNEEEAKAITEDPEYERTTGYVLHIKQWHRFIEQQERWMDDEIRFIWEITGDSIRHHFVYEQNLPTLYTKRKVAEKVFLEHCAKIHGYQYSDAIHNLGEEEAECYKDMKMIVERTQLQTWVGFDEDVDGYGACHGVLLRRELVK